MMNDAQQKPTFIELLEAVASNNIKAVEELLQRGANANGKDLFGGGTPLMAAAAGGRTEIARLLIDNGAELDTSGQDGWTALMGSSFHGETEVVRLLIEKGADISLRGRDGTAQDIAENRAQEGVVQLLKEAAVLQRDRDAMQEQNAIAAQKQQQLNAARKPFTLRRPQP